jgi:TPR repeat protein
LEQDLSMARAKTYAYEAQISKASDGQALSDQAERDLASARRDIETQTALAAKASEEVARLKQVAEQRSAELQQERDRAAGLERDLALARHKKDAAAAPGLVTVGEVAQDNRSEVHAKPIVEKATVAGTRGEPQPNSEDAAEAARLVALASALLGRGDIGAARIVLERAVETGSAQASFTLAETYDPRILPKWGTYGTRGDAKKARDLYAKAEAEGIKEAKERVDALRR